MNFLLFSTGTKHKKKTAALTGGSPVPSTQESTGGREKPLDLTMLKSQPDENTMGFGDYFCPVCDLCMRGEISMKQHLEG